jgi:MFS family permease
MSKTNWRKNINAFLVTTVFQWFYVPIGVWVLIWRHYFSWEQIGIIQAVGLFIQLALELPSGAIADMFGRKFTVLLGRVLGVVGFLLMAFYPSFWPFLIGNSLYLANWAFESGALDALLYDSLKENGVEKKYFQDIQAKSFLYATVGMAAASILGGYMYRYGIQLPYLATAIVAVGALVSALWLEEPKLDSVKVSVSAYIKQNWDGMVHIFRHPLIRSISIFSVLINFIAYVGLWYLYEPRLAEGGFPAEWMGYLVAGTYLIRAIGTKLIPYVQKIGDRKIPLFLAVTQMVGSGLSFLEGRVGAIASVYTRKMNDGFRVPILARLQNDEIDSHYRATSLSAISLLGNVLISAAGPIVGYSIEHYSVRVTLGACFFLGLFLVLPSAVSLSHQIKD